MRIRQQANKCSFGNSALEAIEINIKDKIIDSWAPLELKKKILESEKSLDEIIEMTQVHEQIGLQSKVMDSNLAEPGTSMPINKVHFQNQGKSLHNQCGRCGKSGHLSNFKECPARNVKCHKCGLQGHFSITCRTRSKRPAPHSSKSYIQHPGKRRRTQVNFIDENAEDLEIPEATDCIKNFECFKISDRGQNNDDDIITCHLGGVPITLLIDSGSKANIVNGNDWSLLMKNSAAIWNVDSQCSHRLRGYASGEPLNISHRFNTTLCLPGQDEIITSFYVINHGEISILGKDAAKQLGILKLGIGVNKIERKVPFPKVKNIQIKLTIDPNVKPVRQPVRRVPVSVEALVEKKLEEALEADIIEKVKEPSAWISPIVVIFKSNDDIRLCIDMRRANEAILRENYPLPTFDSFMTRLRKAKYFSRLDFVNAYHQLELDEESRPITTFITHKGMFRYKRLMFGVNSAPEIFQRVIEEMLSACTNCMNYLDDVIVYGSTEEEHDLCLKKVLETFKENNVLLNEAKCTRKVKELCFLGHKLSEHGIDADQRKVETIQNFRSPQTKEELRSFLGLVTYLGKFIPDLGTVTEPLRQLIKQDTSFQWTETHQQSFKKLKESLASLATLSYFDPHRRTRLIADASPVALGAVLLQFCQQGNPYVVSFASKSLSNVERRYSQTEKESLALVWAVERFYYYLSGLEFELVTDHKPLEAIFKPSSKPPARIERWVLRLQSFKFKVIYQSGKSNIADSLSRLCQLNEEESFDNGNEHHIFTLIEKSSPKAIPISQIIVESQKDIQVADAVKKTNNNSWDNTDKNIFFPFRIELSVMGPVLLRGTRIVIPETLRSHILQLAHEGHPGETVMKRRLRAKVWWPLIDKQVERFVKECRSCLLVSLPDKPPPMTRHKIPDRPWQCIAIDLMGPLPNGEQLLVIIDYYSRYQEIKFLKSTTSGIIISHLLEMFSRLGLPHSIRADNGPQFASQEFKEFCSHNNINIIYTPPYWPQANGEVENMNRAIKKRLQICHANKSNYRQELQKFTLMYNTTPHGTTGKSPTQLLMNRNIRDKIPCIAELVSETADEEAQDMDIINKSKGKQREDAARKAQEKELKQGDKVLLQNMLPGHKLTTRFGQEEFTVLGRNDNEVTITNDSGHILRRHVTHLKKLPQSQELSDRKNSNNHDIIPDEPTIPSPQPLQPALTQPPEQPSDPEKIVPLKLKKMEGMWRRVDE